MMNDELISGYYWVSLNSGPEPLPPEPAWYDSERHTFSRCGNEFDEGADQFVVLGACEIDGDDKVHAIMADEIKHSHAMIDELVSALIGMMQRSAHHDGEIKTDSGIFAYAAAKAAVAKATGSDCPVPS
jgi:hypothetical protein